jgi:hypothetical protein
MSSIDASQDQLTINRVKNGWIVYSSSFRSQGMEYHSTHVARTPQGLSELLSAWAEAQEKE